MLSVEISLTVVRFLTTFIVANIVTRWVRLTVTCITMAPYMSTNSNVYLCHRSSQEDNVTSEAAVFAMNFLQAALKQSMQDTSTQCKGCL